ncbi:MAG: alcohol dehydrogenase catalytic domain-containing protein [Kiritimatiellae bacterium]|nr:alcohol dehydrogenase catalytic domain-containing protein [Kiritimatiellia bacterium]
MKAAYRKGGEVGLKEVPLPVPGHDQIRVNVRACGICGTDLHPEPEAEPSEHWFGHEIAGTVAELGPGVRHLRVGQNIVLDSATPCGRCEACRNTRQELCSDIQSFFYLNSFGFAEAMIVPAVCAIPCEDLPPDIACLSEPLGVAIDLVRLADIQPTSNVLLVGPGPIGLMALSLVKRMGARRVFVSAFAGETVRVAAARRLGADAIFDPARTPLPKVEFGCPIDRILVTAPPPALNDAFQVACKGGIVAFIGIGHGERAFCRFDANAFHFKKLQLRASFASPALFTPLALQYLREGVVKGDELISHRFPLDRMAEAMAVAQDPSRALKVIVQP